MPVLEHKGKLSISDVVARLEGLGLQTLWCVQLLVHDHHQYAAINLLISPSAALEPVAVVSPCVTSHLCLQDTKLVQHCSSVYSALYLCSLG